MRKVQAFHFDVEWVSESGAVLNDGDVVFAPSLADARKLAHSAARRQFARSAQARVVNVEPMEAND